MFASEPLIFNKLELAEALSVASMNAIKYFKQKNLVFKYYA